MVSPSSRLPVIVLAGGGSRRFGRDKLTVRLDGRTALARVVDRVRPLASEVIVSTSTRARRGELAPHLPDAVRFLIDAAGPWGTGPAAAIARARHEVASGPMLVVPGDMPWVETRALARFLTIAADGGAELGAPFWQSGETEHLVQWHRGRETLDYLPVLRSRGPTGPRASEFLRAVPRTLLVPVVALSDRPTTFAHLTFPADLRRPRARGTAGGVVRTRLVEGAPKRWYRRAQRGLASGRLKDAARAFRGEAEWYARAHLTLLAQHARDDAARAEQVRPAIHRTDAAPGGRNRAPVGPPGND